MRAGKMREAHLGHKGLSVCRDAPLMLPRRLLGRSVKLEI
jgi:hypothetical protein